MSEKYNIPKEKIDNLSQIQKNISNKVVKKKIKLEFLKQLQVVMYLSLKKIQLIQLVYYLSILS